MGIRIKSYADIRVSHQILQGLGIHTRMSHIAAIRMAAHMRSHLWQRHPADGIILLANVLKVMLPMKSHHRLTIFIQIQETGSAANHWFHLWLRPISDDALECVTDLITDGDHPIACFRLRCLNDVLHVPLTLQLMINRQLLSLQIYIFNGKTDKLRTSMPVS